VPGSTNLEGSPEWGRCVSATAGGSEDESPHHRQVTAGGTGHLRRGRLQCALETDQISYPPFCCGRSARTSIPSMLRPSSVTVCLLPPGDLHQAATRSAGAGPRPACRCSGQGKLDQKASRPDTGAGSDRLSQFWAQPRPLSPELRPPHNHTQASPNNSINRSGYYASHAASALQVRSESGASPKLLNPNHRLPCLSRMPEGVPRRLGTSRLQRMITWDHFMGKTGFPRLPAGRPAPALPRQGI